MSNRLNCEAPPQPEARAAREHPCPRVRADYDAAHPRAPFPAPSPLRHPPWQPSASSFRSPPPRPATPPRGPHPTWLVACLPESHPFVTHDTALDSLYPHSVFLSPIFRLLTLIDADR